jgi:HEAT repeat protein
MCEKEILAELREKDIGDKRRRALLTELGQVGTPQSIDVLRESLRSADVKSQVSAVFALAHIRTNEAVDVLIECLGMETGPRFGFATKSLAEIGSLRALPALIRTLDERRAELSEGDKWMIIHAFIQTPHRSEVPVLAATLLERHRRTRRAAAFALARIRTPESRDALEAAVKTLPLWRGLSVRRALRWHQDVTGE